MEDVEKTTADFNFGERRGMVVEVGVNGDGGKTRSRDGYPRARCHRI
jgi:hypothetical protein